MPPPLPGVGDWSDTGRAGAVAGVGTACVGSARWPEPSGCIGEEATGSITRLRAPRRPCDFDFTSPAVETERRADRADGRAVLRSRPLDVAGCRTSATRFVASPGASGTVWTPPLLACPGQPRKATIALTTASINRAAATRIAVVPRLEMYAKRARMGGAVPHLLCPVSEVLYRGLSAAALTEAEVAADAVD